MTILESTCALNVCRTALQRMLFMDKIIYFLYQFTVYLSQYNTDDVSTCIGYEL